MALSMSSRFLHKKNCHKQFVQVAVNAILININIVVIVYMRAINTGVVLDSEGAQAQQQKGRKYLIKNGGFHCIIKENVENGNIFRCYVLQLSISHRRADGTLH